VRERRKEPLGPYLSAIRAHRGIVAAVTIAAVGASIGFLALRSPQYEASADLLVDAVPQEDQTFLGLAVVRDAGEPTRTVQTAASLVQSRAAADAAAEELGGDWTGERVLEHVEVKPEGETNILAVTATADSPGQAARVANEFARAALDSRAAELGEAARDLIAQLAARLSATPRADQVTRAELAARLDQLRSVARGGDPTVTLLQGAIPPESATGAPPALIMSVALLAGLALGAGTAILLDLSERRVRDEDEALALYPLAPLLRVPELPGRARERPRGSIWHMVPQVREPFRTLAVQLDERGGGGVLMVTSPSAGDGKTTSAVNLAVSLAETGKRVVLLDFDMRKPDVADALRLEDAVGFMQLAEESDHLEPLLQTVSEGWSMRVLAIRGEVEDPGFITGLVDLLGQRLPQLVAEARTLADYVVIDTAPLGEVGDALRLVRDVDDIVLLVRPGNTNRAQLEMVRDLLERIGERPLGYIVLGGAEGFPRSVYSYGHARQQASQAMRRVGDPLPANTPNPPANAPDRPSSLGRRARAQGAPASDGATGPEAPRDPARPGRQARKG
jgi:Mrp family chromosome partitioning ATPase/capsular polysaccharide biosynthesis protein